MKKKLLLLTILALLVAALAACSDDDDDSWLIGISMPTQSSQRWIDDGNNLVAQLEDLGFRTILLYAEDVVADQIAQIDNMIVQGADVLVIAAVDGAALTGVLATAATEGIYVIAYDRMIMDTPNVHYYTTFDNIYVGVVQATSLVRGLGILDGAEGPFNIELFGGSPDDSNAFFFYDGAMSVLQPHIDAGTLVVRSGQMGMDIVGTLGWAAERAQNRMEDLLTAFYADARVDAVLSPYDGLSIGILSALRGVGYGTDAQPWPVVSGQDAIRLSVQSILDSEQYSTVFKDTRELAGATVRMIQAMQEERTVPVNDTTTYHNRARYMPTYLLPVVPITLDNWYEALIQSGYYDSTEFRIP